MTEIEIKIQENENLIYFTLNTYFPLLADDEDMQQVARIALWKAIEKYSPEKGALSTIVVHNIRKKIANELKNKSRHKSPYTVSLSDAIPDMESLTQEDGIEDSRDYINEAISTEYCREILNIFSESDRELIEMLCSGMTPKGCC